MLAASANEVAGAAVRGRRVLQGDRRRGLRLSPKLGIATGRNLPEVCRERFSRRTAIGLWIQAEVIAMATDLAEFLGAALGFHLLLGVPLFPAAVITGVITFAILGLQRRGFRPFEAGVTGVVFVVGVCYLRGLWFAAPP